MKRVTKALCASVLPLAGVVASVAITPTVGGASAAKVSQWAQLQQRAVTAIQAHVGEGALVPQGALGAEVRSTFKDVAGKAVSIDRRALIVRSNRTGNSFVLELSLLGGRQEVVTAQRQGRAITAVFRPDSARVASVTTSGRAEAPREAGGCGGYASTPQVEGTIFGILLEGTGYVDCSIQGENLSELVGLFSGSQLGNYASGSGFTDSLVVDSWAPCYLNSVQSPFQTRMIWSENGTLEGGYTSGNAWYGCSS